MAPAATWFIIILLASFSMCCPRVQAMPNMTVSGNLLAMDLYPETNSWTLRPSSSSAAKPQITVRWHSIIEKIRPFSEPLSGYSYIPTAPVIRTIFMNDTSVVKTFAARNVSWSAENPSLPRLEFGYLFPDGASVKFPMYIFKNADRVVFPLGHNLSLPIDGDTLKFSLFINDWKHTGNASEGELWLGFKLEIEFDSPVVLNTDLISVHTLRPPECTNGSSPNFGDGPVNNVRLDFENLPGTFLKVSIPDLALVDNTTFDCLLSINSMSRDPTVIQQFLASGRTKLNFDLYFKAAHSVEYDPDLTLVFGSNFDAEPPVAAGSTPSGSSDPLRTNSVDSPNIGMIAGIVCGCVVVAAILFVIVAVRYKPLRSRLSVMQWKTSASSRIHLAQSEQPSSAPTHSSSVSDQKASWAGAKVSSAARNSVMSE